MKELAGKIQICINTLAVLNMPSTFDNVNHMTGIYRLLTEVRDQLAAAETEEKADERMDPDGEREEAE